MWIFEVSAAICRLLGSRKRAVTNPDLAAESSSSVLLKDHDCDRHGYEEFTVALNKAKDWLARFKIQKEQENV